MKIIHAVRSLPQPVKFFYFAFLASFVFAFPSIIFSAIFQPEWTGHLIRWAVAVMGMAGILLEALMLTDFRGSAGAVAAMMNEYKPVGVDYSRSPFAGRRGGDRDLMPAQTLAP